MICRWLGLDHQRSGACQLAGRTSSRGFQLGGVLPSTWHHAHIPMNSEPEANGRLCWQQSLGLAEEEAEAAIYQR